MASYVIEVQDETDISDIDSRSVERLAAHALSVEGVEIHSELSIVFADDPFIQELNRTYRDTDTPTDVLSFAQGEGDPFAEPDGGGRHLGDIVVSLDTARRQATEYALALQSEVEHLVVHGILHLLGYDHERPDDESLMRAHEDVILGERAHHH